jgi:HlyD family secretion protein
MAETDTPQSESTAIQPKGIQPWEGSSAYVQQGRHWSSALIWISSSLFVLVVIWAFTARLDQTVTVRGRLEPSGSVEEVESPSAGVVRKVFVREGQKIRAGTPLFDVEAKGLASRREALTETLSLLELQAVSFQKLLRSDGDPARFGPLPPLPLVRDPALAANLVTARQQVQQFRSQLQQVETRLQSRLQTLVLQQSIAKDMEPLYRSGGMARNQYRQQLNQVQETRAEVANLREERARIIGQAAAQLNEINRQILSLRAELVGLKETISYRTVKAPSAGTVFNLKLSPYKVVNSDQVVLKLVPDDLLQAKVDIGNNDIGFIKAGMPATISVDSFPSGEFGYLQGVVTKIGSDALPPDPENPTWRFPALISVKQQKVEAGGKLLNLQSGMSVSVNIKLRTRPVITLVTDMFTKQLDGVKRFR